MSFTELFGFAEGEEREGPEESLRPPWLGAPDDELGVAVPQGIVLAHSERGAIGLSHAITYPSGVVCSSSSLTHVA
jgi:hypothetical protein